VDGGAAVDLGHAPTAVDQDWAVLVLREGLGLDPERRIRLVLPPGTADAQIDPAAATVASEASARIFSGCDPAADHRIVLTGSGDG
ncbi:MAG: hypothetical protein ACOCXJ_08180, partial [Planctomycetota bacterium]